MSEERLLVTGYWLLVLLSTNNQQPTTNNQQPTTNNQQPTTNNQQPERSDPRIH